jgi:hypothetical protein
MVRRGASLGSEPAEGAPARLAGSSTTDGCREEERLLPVGHEWLLRGGSRATFCEDVQPRCDRCGRPREDSRATSEGLGFVRAICTSRAGVGVGGGRLCSCCPGPGGAFCSSWVGLRPVPNRGLLGLCSGDSRPRRLMDRRSRIRRRGEASECALRSRTHPLGDHVRPGRRPESLRQRKTPPERGFCEAAGLGFEPRLPGPEPGVLPLDDPATQRPL